MSNTEVLLNDLCDKLDRIIELLEAANQYLPDLEDDEPVTRFLDTGKPV